MTRPWGAYRFGVVLLVPVLVAAGGWQVVSDRKAASYELLVDDPDHPGALSRTPDFEYWGSEDATIVPPMVALPSDFAPHPGSVCRASTRNTELNVCTGPSSDTPTKRIVVVGDSHMQQYLAPLTTLAAHHDWQVVSMLKGGCPFSADADAMPGDARCVKWNADAAAEIISLNPDLVMANGTRDVRVGPTEHTPAGFVVQWRKLESAGIRVLAVRDNPRFDFGPSACLVSHRMDPAPCSVPRTELLTEEPPYRRIPDLPSNVAFADFSDYYCEPELCPRSSATCTSTSTTTTSAPPTWPP